MLSNQIGYSLVTRSAERDLLPFAESYGRVIIAFRPLELTDEEYQAPAWP